MKGVNIYRKRGDKNMMLIFIFLIVFSLYCTFKNYASKYSVGFLLVIWSLIGLMYVSMNKVACLDQYTTVKLFGYLDYRLFMLFIKPRFSLFTIMKMFTIFSAMYISSLVFFSLSYVNLSALKRWFAAIAVSLFDVAYILFYNPKVSFSVYIRYIETGSMTEIYILKAADFLLWLGVLFVFLLPLFVMLANYKKLSSPYSKRQLIGIFLFVLLTDVLYFVIFKITSIRSLYALNGIYDIISPRSFSFAVSRTYIIIMLICIGCMLYVFTSFNIARTNGKLKKMMLRVKMKRKNTEVRKILHSTKNMLITLQLMLEDAIIAPDEDRMTKISDVKSKSDEFLTHISSLNSMNSSRDDFFQDKIFAEDFMDEIIDQIECPSEIKIEKLYGTSKNIIYIDSFYLTEAVSNIMKNAIQAIEAKGNGGTVTIDIKPEINYTAISIADDGIGIKPSLRKSIFKDFVTTKSLNTNWGVGLSYALDIINMHNGKISYKTKYGNGTTFYILLPSQF